MCWSKKKDAAADAKNEGDKYQGFKYILKYAKAEKWSLFLNTIILVIG